MQNSATPFIYIIKAYYSRHKVYTAPHIFSRCEASTGLAFVAQPQNESRRRRNDPVTKEELLKEPPN